MQLYIHVYMKKEIEKEKVEGVEGEMAKLRGPEEKKK